MSRLWYALWPAAVVLGLGVEWAAFDDGEVGLVVADLLVGWLLIGCGLVAWRRRPESRVGLLMGIAGVTWFAGSLGQAALYLHRGPLVHLHLSYPTGRLPTRLSRVVVIAAYVDAVVEPIARNDPLTLALAALVALASVQIFLQTSGPARKAGVPALAAALAFAAVLALGAAMRLAGLEADNAVLLDLRHRDRRDRRDTSRRSPSRPLVRSGGRGARRRPGPGRRCGNAPGHARACSGRPLARGRLLAPRRGAVRR